MLSSLSVAALLLLLPALAVIRLFRTRRASLPRLLLHGAVTGAVSGVVVVGLASLNHAVILSTVSRTIVPITTALLGAAVASAAALLVGAFHRPLATTTARTDEETTVTEGPAKV